MPSGSVCACRHHKPDRGEAEHQLIRLFADRKALALNDDVTDIAKGEQIAGDGSGEAHEIIGIAGEEAGRKPGRQMRRRSLLGYGLFEPCEEIHRHRQVLRLRQIDKALREIGIAILQRGFDFPVHELRIGGGGFADLQLAEQGRIVLRGKQRCRIARIRPHIGERHRAGRKTREASGQSRQQLHVSLFPLWFWNGDAFQPYLNNYGFFTRNARATRCYQRRPSLMPAIVSNLLRAWRKAMRPHGYRQSP